MSATCSNRLRSSELGRALRRSAEEHRPAERRGRPPCSRSSPSSRRIIGDDLLGLVAAAGGRSPRCPAARSAAAAAPRRRSSARCATRRARAICPSCARDAVLLNRLWPRPLATVVSAALSLLAQHRPTRLRNHLALSDPQDAAVTAVEERDGVALRRRDIVRSADQPIRTGSAAGSAAGSSRRLVAGKRELASPPAFRYGDCGGVAAGFGLAVAKSPSGVYVTLSGSRSRSSRAPDVPGGPWRRARAPPVAQASMRAASLTWSPSAVTSASCSLRSDRRRGRRPSGARTA